MSSSNEMDGTQLNTQPTIVIEEDKQQDADLVEPQENNLKKNDRKRKSKVWSEFSIITLKDGIKKAKCNYCDILISMNSQGSTTQFHRHLVSCPVRMASNGKQRLLTTNVLSSNDFGGGLGGTITTYRYDKDKVRESLAKMIIVHEYPFRMVEHEFFILFCKTLNPRFEKISRVTIRSDCMKLYNSEKKNMVSFFESVDRISLTTDLWTSNQNIGYLCLTGHFLDSGWKLHRSILNFCALAPPHTGVAISDCIFGCLIDWGIEDKISSITLDNASSNDVAVRNLKENFAVKGKLYFGGKIFHVRCCAHVLNLMVQDGLNEIRDVIESIRESVKYLKMSPSRLHRFTEIVKQLQLPVSKGLILDVPTRWNSTYAMLESALIFKDVFPRYRERDPYYRWLPSGEDWERALEVCKFLEVFNDATNVFSGHSYPTSSLFLPEVWKIRQILNENYSNENKFHVQNMASRMREKFDKYWGECSLLMAIGAVLDPRYKMKLIEFCYSKLYTAAEATKYVDTVLLSLYELYSQYASEYSTNSKKSKDQLGVSSSTGNADTFSLKTKTKGRTEFDLWAQELDTIVPIKSDLDIYLEEGRYICKDESESDFSALDWWKANTLKFCVLSNMARDILSIPITSVASESAFSTGGRVLDQYRSSLKSETVQALVCTGDWLRNMWKVSNSVEIDEDDMQKICIE